MPTTVNAPDGTQINFPDSMGDDDIKTVMRKKFPPRTVMQPSAQEQAVHQLSSKQFGAQMGTPMPGSNYEQMAEQQEVDALQPKRKTQPTIGPRQNDASTFYEDALNDIREGSNITPVGHVLRFLGAQPTNAGGYGSVGEFLEGPLLGPLTAAHGASIVTKHPIRGANEIIGGGLQTIGPAAAMTPEFLPMVTGFSAAQKGIEKTGQAAGLDPETAAFLGNVAGLVPIAHGVLSKGGIPTSTDVTQGSEPVLGESVEEATTHRPPLVNDIPENLDSKIANARMRWEQAPALSQKKANLLEVLDQHLQTQLANTPKIDTTQTQPNSSSAPMARNAADLMSASEAKVSPETPEQSAAARDRYLNLSKQTPLGPSKTYDPVTGEPLTPKTGSQSSDTYLRFPETQASAAKADTDFMTQARQDLFPGKEYGELSSAQQSDVIQRAQKFKTSGLGPRGGFAAPPEGHEGERGSLWLKPKNVPNSPSPMGQLTDAVQAGLGTRAPTGDRLSWAEKLADAYGPQGDDIKEGLGKLTAHMAAFVDKYRRPAPYTTLDRAIGEFSGDLQRNNLESRRFVERIKAAVPDPLRREAITNYAQANGDQATLDKWANTPRVPKTADAAKIQDRLVRGYKLALQLTPEEQSLARDVRGYFDNQLHEAQSSGMLSTGIDNYVNQTWKKTDGNHPLATAAWNNDVRPNADLMRKRVFDSYFEGEQAGFIPRNKDIGFLVTAYNNSFNKAVASRAFVSKLAAGTKVNGQWTGALAEDGRPMIAAPAGFGKEVVDANGEATHLVLPRVAPDEELQGYRTLDHPAMQNWKWAGQAAGENILLKGSLQVHPDFYNKLNNALSDSKLRAPGLIKTALAANATMKQTLLSFSAFHQVQEGLHSIFHGKSPFSPPEIDLTSDTQNKLLDHGLVVGGSSGIQDFSEGLQGPGLTKFIPGAGAVMNKYTNYLFNDYIPRLKMQMAQATVERNLKRYGGDLAEDQIYKLSAEQANAAFGELNYKMLGRNPSVQDAMRLMVLAPDFTEARARFVGQALKPYGAEQRMALLRGAAGMYVTARILNKIIDDDYHFDTPFGIVHGDKEYTMRSLPGDIYNLATDPRAFVNHRLAPIFRSVDEFRTGKDEFGRKRDFEGQTIDFLKNMIPIPAQAYAQKKLEKGFSEQDWSDSIAGSVGASARKYRTPAGRLAHQYMMDSLPPDHESRGLGYLADKIRTGKYDPKETQALVQSGKMSAEDVVNAMDMAQRSPLQADFKNLKIKQAIEVYATASDKEKAELHEDFINKIVNVQNLPLEEQKDIQKRLDQLK